MKEVKLTKEQEIIFEVYDKGVQNEDCNLDDYVEKMKQALSIAFVSQQRELLIAYENKVGHSSKLDAEIFVDKYLKDVGN